MRYDQFAEDSLGFNVLLEHGEFHKIQIRVEPVGAPTMETGPRFCPIVSVRIVHKLRAFVRSKGSMVRGGVTVFVIELVGVCVSYSRRHYLGTLTVSLQLQATSSPFS